MPAIIDDLIELELGPVGWTIAALGGVLALSPGARKTLRRVAVRGVAAALSATEGLRRRSAELRESWEDLVAEAQSEMQAEPDATPETAAA
jgi:hypothetical protein